MIMLTFHISVSPFYDFLSANSWLDSFFHQISIQTPLLSALLNLISCYLLFRENLSQLLLQLELLVFFISMESKNIALVKDFRYQRGHTCAFLSVRRVFPWIIMHRSTLPIALYMRLAWGAIYRHIQSYTYIHIYIETLYLRK